MANTTKDKSKNDQTKNPPSGFSRRRFLQGVGVVGAGAIIGDAGKLVAQTPAAPAPAAATGLAKTVSGNVEIALNLNGKERKVIVEPRTTLLSAIRDRLDPPLTGPKLVCNMGSCGACTVIMDGKTAYSCSVLAIDAVGKKITTVEGIGTPDNLSPVQAAFCEKDGMMCGFCTSGFVTSVTAFLDKNANPTLDEVKEACHGNTCRCGTYTRIFEAALSAAKARK
jgi:aerobic-type carbon monoxide dehydrogenase small subunit (CoxS/CutS family)